MPEAQRLQTRSLQVFAAMLVRVCDPKRGVAGLRPANRWKTIGQILGIIFSVTYTLRTAVIRLISARRASQKERDLYKNQ
jgi:uncharacterized DUF497 family protein